MTGPSRQLVDGVIANLPLFRGVARAHLAELTRQTSTQQVAKGRALFRRGDKLRGLYALAYGVVKLALRTPSGDERVVRLVQTGETLGDPLIFLQRPSPLEAMALTDSLVVIIPTEAIHTLFEHDPRLARTMLASLSEQLHALVASLEATSLHSGLQRVAAYLDSLAQPGTLQTRVHLPVTKTVIASHLGITKETFSRLLRDLVQLGLVSISNREITLLDRGRLGALAHGESPPPLRSPRQRHAVLLDVHQRSRSAVG